MEVILLLTIIATTTTTTGEITCWGAALVVCSPGILEGLISTLSMSLTLACIRLHL
jgi:hypothetical protein